MPTPLSLLKSTAPQNTFGSPPAISTEGNLISVLLIACPIIGLSTLLSISVPPVVVVTTVPVSET